MKPWQAILMLIAGLVLGALGMRLFAPQPAAAPAEVAAKPTEKADPGTGLHVSNSVQLQAGLRIAPLAARTIAVQIDGYARAVDPAPLGSIASDIAVATAAHDGSARELARLTALVAVDAGASRRDLDAGRAQEGQDAAKLRQACLRPALEFGPGLGRLGCGSIAHIAAQVAKGEMAIIRLDFPQTAPAAGTAVTVDIDSKPTSVRVLGPAISGDTQLQSGGVLALLTGRAAAHAGVGRIVPAHIGGAGAQSGLIVPREAVVRTDGAMNVYRVTGPDTFERVTIEGPGIKLDPVDQGWFMPGKGPLKAGDRVVVAGAGTLLGLEHSPGADGGGD